MQQVHDFNPGIGSNGLFWLVEVPDDAVKITEDTLTISLKNVPVVDQFSFPNGAGNNLGIAGIPATVSFDITYTKSASMPRHVRPTSSDRLSPFNWAGEMWDATNSGTFSLAYNDGSFSAQGAFSSNGNFGEMGMERNGLFVADELENVDSMMLPSVQPQTSANITPTTAPAALANVPKLKGRVPISALEH